MGYSARLKFTGHTEGEGVTSGLAGTLAHHERSFRLLAQYLQRYLSEITVRIVNDRWAGGLFLRGDAWGDDRICVSQSQRRPLETGLDCGLDHPTNI